MIKRATLEEINKMNEESKLYYDPKAPERSKLPKDFFKAAQIISDSRDLIKLIKMIKIKKENNNG
jgi:hypothetical protein